MSRLVFIIIVLVFSACSHVDKVPIEEMDQDAGFYILQLNHVNDQLKKGKKESELLYKKLYASQHLNWPEDVEKEIRLLIERDKLNFELYNYAADFYITHSKYEALNDLVDNWLEKRSATIDDFRWKIMALNGLQRSVEASDFLWSLLQGSDKSEDQLFVAQTYLQLRDTARALYAYTKFASGNPGHQAILGEYVPVLLQQGYPQKAKDLLTKQSNAIKGYENTALLARTLYSLGERHKAIGLLKGYDEEEGSLLQLAHWYHQLNNWDSAVYYTDKLIVIDSTRQALYKKAEILEDRGWLNAALGNYHAITRLNPHDSIAISRAQIVERKIAYLRRLREKENPTPVLDISSKKSTENE